MIRLLHIPFLMSLMALMAFDAPEKVITLVGAFTLGLSFGIEAVLTLTDRSQVEDPFSRPSGPTISELVRAGNLSDSAGEECSHDWVVSGVETRRCVWRCKKCNSEWLVRQ